MTLSAASARRVGLPKRQRDRQEVLSMAEQQKPQKQSESRGQQGSGRQETKREENAQGGSAPRGAATMARPRSQ